MYYKLYFYFIFFMINSNHIIARDLWENRIYLASFPRSGNHWIRYLIEEATHIVTSSVYYGEQDAYIEEHCRNHEVKEMPWGGYCYEDGYRRFCRLPSVGNSFVVKTHFPIIERQKFDLLDYKLTIRIVRHPIDTIYSNYSTGNSAAKFFIPKKILLDLIQSWRGFNEFWNNQKNVYTVRYEDLMENPGDCLLQILKKIGYEVEEYDINRATSTFSPKGSVLKHLPHYTNEDLKTIKALLGDLMEEFCYEL